MIWFEFGLNNYEYFRKNWDFDKMHWKPHFPPSNFQIIFWGTKKIINLNIRGIYFVQNFTRFLVDPIIFTSSIDLRVKNENYIDPVWIFTSEKFDFHGSNLSVFFTTKTALTVKMNGSMRNLVKFLNEIYASNVSFHIFWCLWKLV